MGPEMNVTSLKSIPALLVTIVLVAGCGVRSSDDLRPESQSGTSVEIVASETPREPQSVEEVYIDDGGEKMFPDGTMEDWAQWSSHVVRGTVAAEKKRTDRTTDAGPYVMVGRDVTLEVTDVLWSNPKAVARVSREDHLTLYTYPGYVIHEDGTEQRAATDDGPRMEVGADYVVAVMDDVVDGEQVLALMRPFAVDKDDSIFVKATAGSAATMIPLHEVSSALESADVESMVPHVGESVSQRWVRYMNLSE